MLSKRQISDLLERIENGELSISAADAVRHLLLLSLSPAEKKTYDLALEGPISSNFLRLKLGWKSNYAGNVLGSLRKLGLLVAQCGIGGIKTYRSIVIDPL